MAFKVVFLLALVALVCGLPASDLNLKSSSDVSAVNEVPASVSEYLEKLFGESPTDIVLENESNELEEKVRHVRKTPEPRNFCRPVVHYGPAGRNITIWDCIEKKTLDEYIELGKKSLPKTE